MFRIELIGLAPAAGLAPEDRARLRTCGAVVAASRHHPLLAGLAIEVLPMAPVAEALTAIGQRLPVMNVAVLASGDPLFFGIGRTLVERFGADRLVVRPALSAVQAASARFKEPWDDARVVSLHGRDVPRLAARLLPHAKVFCFTDRLRSPALVARVLLDACLALEDHELARAYRVWVAENLGSSRERLFTGSLAETANAEFADLNVMLLKRPPPPGPGIALGLTEAEIAHSRGLITKDEVRAASLHALRPPAQGVLWDVGAGSGSVGLEAARLCPALLVYAVEKNPAELANLRANCRRFGVYNLTIVAGEAPEALTGLPDPDRIFIGGSGGRLAEIIGRAAGRLAPGGRLVVNAVTDRTREMAPALLHGQDLRVSVSELAVSRRTYPEGQILTMNQIAIMVGEK